MTQEEKGTGQEEKGTGQAGQEARPRVDQPRVTLSPHPGVSDEVRGHLRVGWWLVLLGLTCAPPVFLPLAIYNAVQAGAKGGGDRGRAIIAAAVVILVVYVGIVVTILLRPPSR